MRYLLISLIVYLPQVSWGTLKPFILKEEVSDSNDPNWISPLDHEDLSNCWSKDVRAYDGSIDTKATAKIKKGEADEYGSTLAFLCDESKPVDKIRFYAYTNKGFDHRVRIGYYDDGGTWNQVYQNVWNQGQWVEVEVGSYLTKVEFSWNRVEEQSYRLYFNEMQYNQVPEPATIALLGLGTLVLLPFKCRRAG